MPEPQALEGPQGQPEEPEEPGEPEWLRQRVLPVLPKESVGPEEPE